MAAYTFHEGTERNFLIGTERVYNVIKDRPTTISYCEEIGFTFPHLELFPDDLFLQLMQQAGMLRKPRGNEIAREKMQFYIAISIISICGNTGYFHNCHWNL